MILSTINTVLSGRLFSECGKKPKVLAKSRTKYHKGRTECKLERENANLKLEVGRRLYLA
jgi:hypothetical protein